VSQTTPPLLHHGSAPLRHTTGLRAVHSSCVRRRGEPQRYAGRHRSFLACEPVFRVVCLIAGLLSVMHQSAFVPSPSRARRLGAPPRRAGPRHLHQPWAVESLCALAFMPCVFKQVPSPTRFHSERRSLGFPGARTSVILVAATGALELTHIPELRALSCSSISSFGSSSWTCACYRPVAELAPCKRRLTAMPRRRAESATAPSPALAPMAMAAPTKSSGPIGH
jgi:hypothetical protein